MILPPALIPLGGKVVGTDQPLPNSSISVGQFEVKAINIDPVGINFFEQIERAEALGNGQNNAVRDSQSKPPRNHRDYKATGFTYDGPTFP